MTAAAPTDPGSRWELYRLLADPTRPRLLALASIEELAVGELAEILGEAQPKISRHASALRESGLLTARRNGTWSLLRLNQARAADAVVADAVSTGLRACEADGTLERLDRVIRARDAATREFFARSGRTAQIGPPEELGAYLAPFGMLLPHRRAAVDVGTGDGALLEVLSPIFQRVVAIDRSEVQVELAKERLERRGLSNVELCVGEVEDAAVRLAVDRASDGAGADVVFASRVLHHARVPAQAMRALTALARPARAPAGGALADRGGAVVVLDYEAHDDLRLRDHEADLWLGFEPAELRRLAEGAGLEGIEMQRLPSAWRGGGPDRHLPWQLLVGWRGRV